jgi:DNA-binding CsgD family transcriptional regulator
VSGWVGDWIGLAEATGLVGREDELAVVEEFALGDVRRLLIEGPAGIGKTALWAAALGVLASAGACGMVSRPGEAEASYSFAVLADLLVGISPERLEGLPPPQARALEVALLLREPEGERSYGRAVAAGFLSVLRLLAAEQPLVIAIDDVQWADEASAAALGYALRRLDGQPVRFLFSRRSGTLAAHEYGRGFTRIELGPLSLGAIQRLLRSRLSTAFPRPLVARIHAESGGNPFFALELGRAMLRRDLAERVDGRLPVPAHLSELVRERLEILPETTRDALGFVAALADARPGVVEAAGIADHLEPAFRAGVVEIDGQRVRFTHPLLAGCAYSLLSASRRRDVHRQLAGLVLDPEERARHLALGSEGSSEQLAQTLDEAARLASARGAPAAAATLVDFAVQLAPPADPGARARRQIDAAAYRFVAGETAAARAALEPIVQTLPPGRERARALLHLGMTREDDLPAAAGYLERAAEEAEDDDMLLVSVRVRQADLAGMRGDFAGAAAYARAALESAEHSGDQRAIALALPELAHAEQRLGTVTPGLLERAVRLEDSLPDPPPGHRSARRARATYRLTAGLLDAARIDFESVRSRALDQGDEFEGTIVLAQLADLECLAGNLAAALQHAERGVETAEQLGLEQTLNTLRCQRALVASHLGREEEARADAQAALLSAESIADGLGEIRARAALGFLELSLGDMATAVERLRPLTELAPDASAGVFRYLPNLIEGLLALGETEEAGALLLRLEVEDTPWTRACRMRCRGLLLAAGQDLEGAQAALTQALAAHEHLPMPLEHARTLLAAGQVHRRSRQKRAARESLRAALAICEQIGAPLWAEKARAELARISGRGPASGELTETERRIAELVAAGKSNKQVAAELFLSVHTVEDNLKRTYRKLGVRSRTELARRMPAG